MKPMLGYNGKYELSNLKYPVMVGLKRNGVRVLTTPQGVRCRSMKSLPNRQVNSAIAELPMGIDGEFIAFNGGKVENFNLAQSIAMSRDAQVHPDKWRYCLFDVWHSNLPYRERYKYLTTIIDELKRLLPQVELVHHFLAKNAEEVMQFYNFAVGQGFEGIVIKNPSSLYKQGRSTLSKQEFLKLKPLAIDIAKVIGVQQLMKNTNEQITNELGYSTRSTAKAGQVPVEQLGALEVEHSKFGKFKIGTGFNEFQRKEIWRCRETIIGQKIKFSYDPTSFKNKPTKAVFIEFDSQL